MNYNDKFFIREDCYGGYNIEKEGKKAKGLTIKSPLTNKISPLKTAIGAHTSYKGISKYICIDLDASKQAKENFLQGNITQLQNEKTALLNQSHSLFTFLYQNNLTPLLEDSNGGYHIWIFLKNTKQEIAFKFGQMLKNKFNLNEVFPKQPSIQEGKFGNWVRVPGVYPSIPKDGQKIYSKIYNFEKKIWIGIKEKEAQDIIINTPSYSENDLIKILIPNKQKEKTLKNESLELSKPLGDENLEFSKPLGNENLEFSKRISKDKKTRQKQIKTMISCLEQTKNVCNSYENFLKLAMAFKSENIPYELVDKVFQQSDNYNYKNNKEIYEKLQPRDVTIATAFYIAKKHNKVLLETSLNKINTKKTPVKVNVFESDGKTYYATPKGAKDLANFTCRILEKITNDNHETSWKIKINQTSFIIPGQDFFNPIKFSEFLAKRDMLLYDITSKKIHTSFIKHIDSVSEYETLKSTQYLGKVPGKAQFLMNSNIITKEGAQPIKNTIVPAGLMFYKEPPSLFEFWVETIEIYKDLLGLANTISVIGFTFCTLHLDDITKHYNAFPLLFLSGTSGSGKSTQASFISCSLGCYHEIKPFNFGSSSTQKSFLRTLARYRGCPVFANEYVPNKKNNALMSSIYDRESYSRAKTDNTLSVIKSEMNASVMLASTRNISDYEAQALISRVVTVHCEKSNKKGLIDELILNKEYLSSFIKLGLMVNMETFWKFFEIIQKEMIKKTTLDSRIIFNHSLLLAGYYCVSFIIQSLTNNSFNPEKFNIEPELSTYIEQAQAQQKKTSDAGIAKKFLLMVLMLAKEERLPGAMIDEKEKKLYFNLNACFGEIKRFSKQSEGEFVLPDAITIKRELKNMNYYQNTQKWIDGNMRCYCIPLKDIGENSEFDPEVNASNLFLD